MKKLKSLLATGLIFLVGCASNKTYLRETYSYPRIITLEQKVYSIEENKLKQESNENKQIKFGVVADIHNEIEKAKKIANKFGKENLDGIIIAGDMSRKFGDKKKVPEEKEIRDSLIPFLETGKPVYVIAGNHETKNTYFKIMQELVGKYNNLFDLATLKYVDLKGLNIFGVSGGSPHPRGGFSVEKEIKKVDKRVFSLDEDPVFMISHMPAKFQHEGAIDSVYDILLLKTNKKITDRHKAEELIYKGEDFKKINFKNDGIKELTDLINKQDIDFSVSGHYHMNRGANNLHENISEDKYSEKLFMNPGGCQYDMVGILAINGDKAKYELLKVE